MLEEHSQVLGAAVIDVYQQDLVSWDVLATFITMCQSFGLQVILDETKSSGRLASLGMTEHRGLKPDMVILGKAIANGAPLSILLIASHDSALFRLARVGGTHSKETFGVAAAIATADIMLASDGYAELAGCGRQVVSALTAAAANADAAGYVSFAGRLGFSAFDVLVTPGVAHLQEARRRLGQCFVDEGILLLVGHPSFLTLAHRSVATARISEMAARALGNWVARLEL
jgi:glutamate-1-semialdehyde 2,1-aminomutase